MSKATPKVLPHISSCTDSEIVYKSPLETGAMAHHETAKAVIVKDANMISTILSTARIAIIEQVDNPDIAGDYHRYKRRIEALLTEMEDLGRVLEYAPVPSRAKFSK